MQRESCMRELYQMQCIMRCSALDADMHVPVHGDSERACVACVCLTLRGM